MVVISPPSRLLRSNDQIMESLCQLLASRPSWMQKHFALVSLPFRSASCYLFIHQPQLLSFRKHLKTHLFDLAFPSDTSMPDGPLMLLTTVRILLADEQRLWLPHRWAWRCQGYGCYRNLCDWVKSKVKVTMKREVQVTVEGKGRLKIEGKMIVASNKLRLCEEHRLRFGGYFSVSKHVVQFDDSVCKLITTENNPPTCYTILTELQFYLSTIFL